LVVVVDVFPLELAAISANDQIPRDFRRSVSASATELFTGTIEFSSELSETQLSMLILIQETQLSQRPRDALCRLKIVSVLVRMAVHNNSLR